MSTIIAIIKIIMFLFPFLKELFIGKGKEKGGADQNTSTGSVRTKKIVIMIGCLSVAMNFYLVSKVYNLGRENLILQKQVKEKIPKPMVYPDKNLKKEDESQINIRELDTPKDEDRRKRKIKPPQALPVERDRFLKQLEEINKII